MTALGFIHTNRGSGPLAIVYTGIVVATSSCTLGILLTLVALTTTITTACVNDSSLASAMTTSSSWDMVGRVQITLTLVMMSIRMIGARAISLKLDSLHLVLILLVLRMVALTLLTTSMAMASLSDTTATSLTLRSTVQIGTWGLALLLLVLLGQTNIFMEELLCHPVSYILLINGVKITVCSWQLIPFLDVPIPEHSKECCLALNGSIRLDYREVKVLKDRSILYMTFKSFSRMHMLRFLASVLLKITKVITMTRSDLLLN